VIFTPPAATGDLGTYGQSSELLAVKDGAWGSEFTGEERGMGYPACQACSFAAKHAVPLQLCCSPLLHCTEPRVPVTVASTPFPCPSPAAVVWYKGAQAADSNAVLLQVAYADETSGDLKPSATWRVGGFSDVAQG